jgi:hypothetical protein
MLHASAFRLGLPAATAILFFPIVTYSHHSRAEFADEILDVPAEIVDVAWRNPHPAIMVRVTNDAGEEEIWRVEGWSSANTLDRQGVTGDTFEIGDQVRVAVQASTRRAGAYLGRTVLLEDGTEASLGGPAFWDNASMVTTSGQGSTAAQGEARGIFRVWTFVDREGGGGPNLPLTASARAQLEGFDEGRDHPLYRCEPVGMPIAMDSTLPIQVLQDGENIVMRLEQNDVARTIRMSPTASADGQAATPLGYSVGRWEGNTLEISTNRIDYPYFNDDGVPMSEDLEIIERFTISDDEQTLEWHATVTDPENFSAPIEMTAHWRWVPGETIKPWECTLWPAVR